MTKDAKFIGLDVGERRIGVAIGDPSLRLAWPHGALDTDDSTGDALAGIIKDQTITDIVVGRPRNQSGATTHQTDQVQKFVDQVLTPLKLPVHWQDESVTSVMAEERLKTSGKTYAKGDIDAEAATIILQDFLEAL